VAMAPQGLGNWEIGRMVEVVGERTAQSAGDIHEKFKGNSSICSTALHK